MILSEMNSQDSINVKNLSKVFKLRQEHTDSEGRKVNELSALANVSFKVRKGESIGIIGPNGSGKSTLLKILAGVSKPTNGLVQIRGKVASMLDIGAGFHPELTGMQNIYLHAQLHGFTKKEVKLRFEDIVEYSGIRAFINEPVKNYSNGMYLRLAFSTMVHFDYDVYLFDEVFSVGDAKFAIKTKEKFRELIASDKTIIGVSHNVAELNDYDRYFHLENGKLKEVTNKKSVLSDYLEVALKSEGFDIRTERVVVTDFQKYEQSDDIRIDSISLFQEGNNGVFMTDNEFQLTIDYTKLKNSDTVDVAVNFLTIDGTVIITASPFIYGNFSDFTASGRYSLSCIFPAPLFNAKTYGISVFFLRNMRNTVLNNREVGHLPELGNKSSLILQMPNVIMFKPLFAKFGERFDLSSNDIIQEGLLPKFKWEIASANSE